MSTSSNLTLCCNPNDREFADQLAEDLRAADLDIMVSCEGAGGRRVDEFDHLLVLLSEHSMQRHEWVQCFRRFQERNKPVSLIRIDETPLPETLEELNWVDFAPGYRSGLNGLIAMVDAPQVPAPSIDLSTLIAATNIVNTDLVQQRILRVTAAALVIYILLVFVELLLFDKL